MFDFFVNVPINWLILATILIALEVILPGVYIIWFGFAALAMAAITFIVIMGINAQLGFFATFSLIAIFIGVKVYRNGRGKDEASTINTVRGSELIGRVFKTTQESENGVSRLQIGESNWLIAGEDCPANTPIKIIGVNSNTLSYIIYDPKTTSETSN